MQPPDVLGLELETALARLRAAGFTVTAEEVRSRGGVAGNEKRVIRERYTEGTVQLCYAVFKTGVDAQITADKAERS